MPDIRVLETELSGEPRCMTLTLKRNTRPDDEPSARKRFGSLLPGLALCGGITLAAVGINHCVPAASPLLLAE